MARIAIIVDQMFQEQELQVPRERLLAAGHEVTIIGVEKGKRLEGEHRTATVTTDESIDDASATSFDALVIPGGYSPDHLRTHRKMVAFTRAMFDAGKPVAAICHAGSMLIEADLVDGRTVTSWPSIRTDLINAGARWVDRQVVEDGNLITSRNPGDLAAFSEAILAKLSRPSEAQPTIH